VGSGGFVDHRQFANFDTPKRRNRAFSLMNTTSFTHSGGVHRQIPFSNVLKTNGGDLEVTVFVQDSNSASNHVFYRVMVDGMQKFEFYTPITSGGRSFSHKFRVPVPPGEHLVELRGFANAGTGTSVTDGNMKTALLLEEVF
jgi:hypothetical protein